MTRPAWMLMHELEIYTSCPKMDSLSVAEDVERRLINIPSSAKLGEPGPEMAIGKEAINR
jgi:perosamine synthetase